MSARYSGSFDSFADRLADAELDYREAVMIYEATDPNTEDIMTAAKEAEEAAKVLVGRALTVFYLPDATQKDKEHTLEILDRLSKDANKREQTCIAFCRKKCTDEPALSPERIRLRRLKRDRMSFLNRCMRTQAIYIKRKEKDPDNIDPETAADVRAAIHAERVRNAVPKGSWFCPPRIFPHERIPEGLPVPPAPDVFQRVKEMEPDHMIFDEEHQNFIIEPGYISEDGLIDDKSVVWDYGNHRVTMKYRGGVPVTWDFKQYIDPADVPRPGEWIAEYLIRVYDQEYRKSRPGLFVRGDEEDKDPPDYNRIPKK